VQSKTKKSRSREGAARHCYQNGPGNASVAENPDTEWTEWTEWTDKVRSGDWFRENFFALPYLPLSVASVKSVCRF